MSKAISAIFVAGITGVIGWAFAQELKRRQEATKAVYIRKPDTSNTKGAIVDVLFNAFSGLDDLLPTSTPTMTPQQAVTFNPTQPQRSVAASGGVRGLLDLIGSVEAPRGYDQYYGKIRSSDGPPRPLTQMTVNEVLAWQDSIDSRYPSEAAGRYQVMEDTLRPLVTSGQIDGNAKYDSKTQDEIALKLLERRGLSRFLAGEISETSFGQKLAQEWASFPAQTVDKRGRSAAGQSYYAGDGLNKSHLSKDRVLSELKGLR